MSEKTNTVHTLKEPVRPDWLYGSGGALRFHELARRGIGWKLHLNFDPENPVSAERVEGELRKLHESGKVPSFKIGKGGGKESGAPGKEATVYVGPRDNAEVVATYIDKDLRDVLIDPEGDTLIDDQPFATKVMGRFDIGREDGDFHQYGAEGVPFLKRDMDPWNKRERDVALAAANRILTERYGTYYTGSVTAAE